MITSTEVEPGRTRLELRGELDASSAEQLRLAVAAIAEGDIGLDLSAVTFVDSSGLASIIEASLVLQGQGRSLAVDERSAVVSRVLELSGVDAHLGLGPS